MAERTGWTQPRDQPDQPERRGYFMPNLGELTGTELDRTTNAVTYLLSPVIRERLPQDLRVKLDTFRADLAAEREDRRKLAAS